MPATPIPFSEWWSGPSPLAGRRWKGDLFVDNLFDPDPAAVVAAAQKQRAQLRHPPLDVDRYLDVLLRQGLVQTVKALSTYRAIL